MSDAVVILAAGKGTRMKSDLPKVLHPIGNAPMLHHAMQTGRSLEPERLIVVAGHQAELVTQAVTTFDPNAEVVIQEAQMGTGHAVLAAADLLSDVDGDLFVLYGDTPLIRFQTLAAMRAARGNADIVALGFDATEPGGYGRFVLRDEDSLTAIVEAKDASDAELQIRICNSGLIASETSTMLELLGQLQNDNAQGEYYLTDIVALAVARGLSCRAVLCPEEETMGINDRVQLSQAEAIFQSRARQNAMMRGATLIAPETVFFSLDTKVGRDVVIHPSVVFGPGVSVGDECEVKAFTHLEDTTLAPDVKVGPFSRLRGGTELSTGVRIGNFVETKNAKIGEGTKAGHLSYLGDAVLGADVNIGAGTITCNYDGFQKSQTSIADGAFIGVNTALIAPVSVGASAYVGTGTVVTEDVPSDALALSRTPQVNREGTAKRLREMLARKAAKGKVD